MRQTVTMIIFLLLFRGLLIADTNSGSVTLSGHTTREIEILRDSNFRCFIRVLAQIEENYERLGKVDRKKILCGALRGVTKFGLEDKYADFIPAEDEATEYRKSVDGEIQTTEGAVVEDITVGWLDIKNKICLINIVKFRGVTTTQFDRCVVDMIKDRPEGLVLDLRGNGGGGIAIVADILCYLMNQDCLIATEECNNGQKNKLYPWREGPYRFRKNAIIPRGFEFLREVPIVVLVDGDTASAGEMMAVALRDNSRAILVGTKTFGKSIFQERISSKIGSLKMTTGRWLTPKSVFIHGKGIIPDHVVGDTRGNGANPPIDAQLEKALEILSEKTKKAKGR